MSELKLPQVIAAALKNISPELENDAKHMLATGATLAQVVEMVLNNIDHPNVTKHPIERYNLSGVFSAERNGLDSFLFTHFVLGSDNKTICRMADDKSYNPKDVSISLTLNGHPIRVANFEELMTEYLSRAVEEKLENLGVHNIQAAIKDAAKTMLNDLVGTVECAIDQADIDSPRFGGLQEPLLISIESHVSNTIEAVDALKMAENAENPHLQAIERGVKEIQFIINAIHTLDTQED